MKVGHRIKLVKIPQYSPICTHCGSFSTKNLGNSDSSNRTCFSCSKVFSPRFSNYIEKYIESNK
jgi:hypothetical protein